MAKPYVIDADGHVLENEVDWAQRLEPAYRERAPRVLEVNGRNRCLVEGRLYPIPEGPGQGNSGPFSDDMPWDRLYREGMRNPTARLADMDAEGIDVAVLFGTYIGLTLPNLADPGLATALARAYNDWLAEYCAAAPGRLKGVALLPIQDVACAVAELERATARLGHVTAMLPTNVHGRNLDHPDLYPLYDAAEQLGIPLSVHAGVGHNGLPGHYGTEAAGTERFDRFFYTHCVAFPFEQMIAVLCIVCGGVLDRFPRLRVGFFEAGVGWLPYWMQRMDEHYERLRPQVPLLRRPPSEHVRGERFFISCDPDEETLPEVVAHVGADRILYASDYAHWDSSFPDSVRLIAERDGLSDAAKAQILGGNAARFLNLSPPAPLPSRDGGRGALA
jgi:predicted TIM-barrel fold metal-dependent hydrolase